MSKKEYMVTDIMIAGTTGKRNPFPKYLVVCHKEEKDEFVYYEKKDKGI